MICTRMELIDAVFAYVKDIDAVFYKDRSDYQSWWRKVIWFFTSKPNIFELSMRVVDWDDHRLKHEIHKDMQFVLRATDGRIVDAYDLIIKYPKLKEYINGNIK